MDLQLVVTLNNGELQTTGVMGQTQAQVIILVFEHADRALSRLRDSLREIFDPVHDLFRRSEETDRLIAELQECIRQERERQRGFWMVFHLEALRRSRERPTLPRPVLMAQRPREVARRRVREPRRGLRSGWHPRRRRR